MTRCPPTRRELDVLAGVVREGSIQAAACRLGLAESTVNKTLGTVRVKVGASNTTQAVWILRHELERLEAAADAGSPSRAGG